MWRVLPLESVLQVRDIHRGLLMLRKYVFATFSLVLTGLSFGADTADSLTGLPMPDAASGMSLGSAIALPPAQVCRSTHTSEFYSVSGFKTSTAIAWYSVHLKGFRHLHGYGAGRSQDIFVNADGSLFIGITGSPASDGADTETYAISYATLKPGLSDKSLKGLLSQNMTC
jgi:hypothetical protein